MKVIDMGLNTTKGDPKWDSLVAEFKATVEEAGEAQASWSCTGRTRHEWQSHMLQEELQDEPWEWEIDYWSYLCIARKKVSE